MAFNRLVFALPFVMALDSGCTGATTRFALRDPVWRDPDLEPIAFPCAPDPTPPEGDPGHRVCGPEPYESSFVWDGADNLLFRPIARFFAVDPAGEAANVNSVDEVPDSSWYTNRIGRGPLSPDDIERSLCGEKPLDPEAPDGSWVIDQGKPNGANPGFRIKVEGLGKFMLKADPVGEPERATGATAIASRLYHAAGYFAPCDSVVYVRRALLTLKPGLTVTDNSGVTRPFDNAALEKLLSVASQREGRVRMVASKWLPERTLGPYTYAGRRDDDPHDIVPHEDRRDLRGARLIAAWLNHFDSREQNTMSTWAPANPKDKDASPGFVRHWYIDLGDCFGSVWEWDGISRRLGFAYYLDFPYLAEDFVTLGTIERPWERARRDGGIFNYFSARDFDPEMWRGGYPNPAFNRMTEQDGAWAARVLARFTKEHIEYAAQHGDYTDPAATDYLIRTLLARQRLVLRRYLGRLSPLADVHVESGTRVCATDLARSTHVFSHGAFHYAAQLERIGERSPTALSVEASSAGRVCVSLPQTAPESGVVRDDDASRYRIVRIANGAAKGPLEAHLYDLGPSRGLRLVGIVRPEQLRVARPGARWLRQSARRAHA